MYVCTSVHVEEKDLFLQGCKDISMGLSVYFEVSYTLHPPRAEMQLSTVKFNILHHAYKCRAATGAQITPCRERENRPPFLRPHIPAGLLAILHLTPVHPHKKDSIVSATECFLTAHLIEKALWVLNGRLNAGLFKECG